MEGSTLTSSSVPKFSSIVDDVFELEKGSFVPNFSVQGPCSTYGISPVTQFGSGAMSVHSAKVQTPSPKWEGGLQASQHNNLTRVSGLPATYSGRMVQSGSAGSISGGPGRSQFKKLSASKSDQDLTSLRSPPSGGIGSYPVMDENQLTTSGILTARHFSSSPQTGHPASGAAGRPAGPINSPGNATPRNLSVSGYNSWIASPVCKILTFR